MIKEGVALIKWFEGFRSDPYIDAAGVATIGFGSTYREDGNRVTMDHPPITQDQAERLLMREVKVAELAVARLISVPLTPEQSAALGSFTYNLGSGALQRSTLRQRLNRGDYDAVFEEFPKWRMAGGRVLAGLVRRRQEEIKLWSGGNQVARQPKPSSSAEVSFLLSWLWPQWLRRR